MPETFWTDAEMAAIESGEIDTGAWVQTREEVQADMQAETLAAADLENESFYEDDEPVEKIMMAFTRGERFVTERPADSTRKTGETT